MPESARASTRIGVLGGTFDPLHIGHLVGASEVLHSFELDQVVFLPTGRPWQKAGYSEPEDRFMMAMLGAEAHRSFAVSRIELDRRGPTYTADSMAQLRDFYGPDVALYFIVGADSLLQLHTWERLDELRDLVEMIAVTRPGFDLTGLQHEDAWPKVHVVEMPGIGISATDIRERVKNGRPIDFLVPAPVRDFIRRQGLYVG